MPDKLQLEQFIKEILPLEVSLRSKGNMTQEEIAIRRIFLFEALKSYPESVVHRAVMLVGTKGDGWFPTPDELVDACEEVIKGDQEPVVYRRKEHKPRKHVCSTEKPTQTKALASIPALLGDAGRYEVEHILCPSDIEATCPYCGKGTMDKETLQKFIEMYPGEENHWNTNWKGLLVCSDCEGKK